MRLEASTPKEALEWRDAFTATVGLLDKRGNAREGAVRAKRRFNLHDRLPPQRVAQVCRTSSTLPSSVLTACTDAILSGTSSSSFTSGSHIANAPHEDHLHVLGLWE